MILRCEPTVKEMFKFLTYIVAPLVQIRMESLIIGAEKTLSDASDSELQLPMKSHHATDRGTDSKGDRYGSFK